jgi:hypothetical protein
LERLRKVVDDSNNCRTSDFEVAEVFMDEWPIIEAALKAAKKKQVKLAADLIGTK